MSGRKKGFVGVDRSVLERIRARAAERSKQNSVTLHLDDSGLVSMEAEIDRTCGRQTALEAMFVDCSADLQTLEAQVGEQIRSLQHGMVAQLGSIELDVRSAFQDVSDHINDLHSDVEANRIEMARLGEVVDGIEAREEALFIEAERWLDGATRLLEFIDAVYKHDRLAPGTFADLEARLSRAELAYQRGGSEAAYVLAESVYFDLSKLRITLETQTLRSLAFHQAARTQAAGLHQFSISSREVNAWDLEGNELDIMVDADYWSQRQLGRQSSRLARLVEELTRTTTEALDPVWLEQLVFETLPEMQRELDQTLTQARLAALEAQLRANIAERVIEALEGQGYQMVGENLPKDFRDGCRVKMVCLDGSSVEVLVAGIPGHNGQNELMLLSDDVDRRSSHELDRRASEVVDALAGTGLVVGQFRADELDRQTRLPGRQVITDLKVRQPAETHLMGE